MPIFEYCEIINKSKFSKCQIEIETLFRARINLFPDLKTSNPFQIAFKKRDSKFTLALYQPVFCKRRSSCTTDERNIAADFDRNVYSWSLLSIRAHQLVNRLLLSASPQGGKSEGGESFLLFPKSYSLASYLSTCTSLSRNDPLLPSWNVSNTRNDISARPMSRVVRPNEAWKRQGRKRVREALDFKMV